MLPTTPRARPPRLSSQLSVTEPLHVTTPKAAFSAVTGASSVTSGSSFRTTSFGKDIEAQVRRVCPAFVKGATISTTREHFRDVSFGPFTLHRLFLLLSLAASVVGLYFLQNAVWPPAPFAPEHRLWAWLALIWLLPLPSAAAWIVGALLFRHDVKLDEVVATNFPVVLRIVSRGTNGECLLATIRKCQQEMKKTPLFPYLIEVVTDGNTFVAPPDLDVLHTVVPDDYTPGNGTRFKARALHFAARFSAVPPTAWILHLDEESQPTSSCIKGVAAAVARCERTGDVRRVGQGAILYHRGWGTHPLLTLADMRRTGDDIGHFYLQHSLGFTIFGLHGSYVLARQDLESELGFDVGPRGSITEDAWWILRAMEKGVRTMWVDGYVEEQCTQSVVDFLKQRRRWYVGLLKTCLFCPVKLWTKFWLMYNTLNWMLVPIVLPLQLAYLVASIVLQRYVPPAVRALTLLVLATAYAAYLSGLVVNMREHGTPWYRGIMWTIVMLLMIPLFHVLEVVAIFMALFAYSENAKGFHVVQKSSHFDDDSAVTDASVF